MKDAMSLTTIFQIVVLFILLFTAIMAVTINNSNAFGMKDQIINYIERNNGNFIEGTNLNDELIDIIKDNSYHTTGICNKSEDKDEEYRGYNASGAEVSDGQKALVCIKTVDVTGGIDRYLARELGEGMVSTDTHINGKYYIVKVFYNLDLPVINQSTNFSTKSSTKILYSR